MATTLLELITELAGLCGPLHQGTAQAGSGNLLLRHWQERGRDRNAKSECLIRYPRSEYRGYAEVGSSAFRRCCTR